MKKIFLKKVFFYCFVFCCLALPTKDLQSSEIKTNLKEKRLIKINNNYSFKYEFVKNPKIGTVVLKITAFNKKGIQTGNLDFIANYDMPAMRGSHTFFNKKFKKNKNNIYLLPVNFVMRGVWEVNIVVKESNRSIFSGVFMVKI
ncbi:MAG: hypothetical protein LBU55_03355 [Elusimicrobiota bacterium]|jgi:hypothetical protein|nr:hypothetical protein [Elusimicrobiota bacterium]